MPVTETLGKAPGDKDRQIPTAHGPASRANLGAPISVRDFASKTKVESNRGGPLPLALEHTSAYFGACTFYVPSQRRELCFSSSEEIQNGKEAFAQCVLDNPVDCFQLAYFNFALLGKEPWASCWASISSLGSVLLIYKWESKEPVYLLVMVHVFQCNFLAIAIFVNCFILPFEVTSSSNNFKVDWSSLSAEYGTYIFYFILFCKIYSVLKSAKPRYVKIIKALSRFQTIYRFHFS